MVGNQYNPFELGVYAYTHGHGLEKNPYVLLSHDWEQWRSGWLFSRSTNLDPDISI